MTAPEPTPRRAEEPTAIAILRDWARRHKRFTLPITESGARSILDAYDALAQRVREVEGEAFVDDNGDPMAVAEVIEYVEALRTANASLQSQLTAATQRLAAIESTGREWLTAVDVLVGASGLTHSVPFDILARENAAMLAHKNTLRAALAAASPDHLPDARKMVPDHVGDANKMVDAITNAHQGGHGDGE